ncbi:hypothetical protein ACFC1L_26980 [Streptomyces sp. NPDC056210]|uniref:hypothetical protein n=1 Tax=Streptomyces sp. NPDC056210 TaxID=3345746 RepID=UPI0035D77EBE
MTAGPAVGMVRANRPWAVFPGALHASRPRHPGPDAEPVPRHRGRRVRQRHDLRHVAELIVWWAQAGHLASDIRHKLERSMATRAPLRPEPG